LLLKKRLTVTGLQFKMTMVFGKYPRQQITIPISMENMELMEIFSKPTLLLNLIQSAPQLVAIMPLIRER